MSKFYKSRKRGAGRHLQLSEHLQSTEAWASLKPGPRALYIELKRRYNGSNNGRIFLSHRDAAKALNVHRNTVGPYFKELEERGLIRMTQAAHLGVAGIGQAALWALEEVTTVDGKPATRSFIRWKKKPRTKTVPARHKGSASAAGNAEAGGDVVLKLVTRG
jgi:hypothetical protein